MGFAVVCFSLHAQSPEQVLDSLQQRLSTADDTTQVLILLEISKRKAIKQPDEAIQTCRDALSRAKALKYIHGEAAAYCLLVDFNLLLVYAFDAGKSYVDSALLLEDKAPLHTRHLIYNAAGQYHALTGAMDESYYWFLKALRLSEGREDEAALTTYSMLGYNANLLGKYADARHYFKRCVELAEKIGRKSFVGSSLTNLATVYMQMQDYDSALVYLRSLYRFELEHGNPNDNVLLLTNLGNAFIELRAADSAYHYFIKALGAAKRVNLREGYEGAYLGLSAYYQNRIPDSAIHYAQMALRVGPDVSLTTKVNATRILAGTFAAKRLFDSAYHYQREHLTYYDSLMNEKKARQIRELELQYGLEKKEDEIRDLQQAQALQDARQRFLVLGLVAAMGLLAGLYFYFRLLIRTKKKALQNANRQLSDYLERLLEKSELIEELNMQLEKARTGHVTNEHLENLDKVVNSTILTDDDWREFKTIFEKVHRGFFADLLKKFPDLTNAEMRLAALLKLKLSTREIAAMLGISPESVSKTRHRLRKRLNLPAEEDLQEFITNVQA
jgi:tetratricopeptide (TPR) repeat protein